MSNDLMEASARAKALLAEKAANPTVSPDALAAAGKDFIPLSVPMRKLEVPPIPGFHCRWLRGTAARLAQAERAGFVFVHPDEVKLNNVSIGGDAKKDGNTDLGARVSVAEGSEVDSGGQAVRMYLMKQPQELYEMGKKILDERNEDIAAALTAQYRDGTIGGMAGESSADTDKRYVDKTRTRVPEFFRKKVRRPPS